MTITTRKPRSLTWFKHDSKVWATEEQYGGYPDFIIYKEKNSVTGEAQFRLDHRTSACPTYHPSLAAAKLHAKGI